MVSSVCFRPHGPIFLPTRSLAQPWNPCIRTCTGENEPWAWLGVALLVTLVVGAYSRAAGRNTLNQLLVLLLSGFILAGLLLLAENGSEWAVFLLYLWKDIYIVVLVELFWSISNSVFPAHAAKWLYGVFSCVGGLGAFTGGRLAKGLSAAEFGPESSLWVVVVFLVALTALTLDSAMSSAEGAGSDVFAGFRVVRSSRYLGSLVAIIVLTLAITRPITTSRWRLRRRFPINSSDRVRWRTSIPRSTFSLWFSVSGRGGPVLSRSRNTLVAIP